VQDTTQTKRRAIDNIWTEKTPDDVVEMLKEIRVTQMDMMGTLKAQSRAFIPNEFQEPDYDGHRKDHIKLEKSSQLVDTYKTDATKSIITLGTAFVVGLVFMGLLQYLRAALAGG
jgi:hypothetical protein